MRTRVLNRTLRWTLSFPNFTLRNVPFENGTLLFGPNDFVPAARRPGIRNIRRGSRSYVGPLFHRFEPQSFLRCCFSLAFGAFFWYVKKVSFVKMHLWFSHK